MDCVDFLLLEQYPFNSGWCSYKFNKAGLRYEIGICIQTGLIVWVNGPFPAGTWVDITIFRHGLIAHLLPWEMVEADDGYRGQSNKIRTKHEAGVTLEQYRAKGAARARHETINGRFKIFDILTKPWRHDRNQHWFVVRAIAVITQLSLMERPAFSVTYPAPLNFY